MTDKNSLVPVVAMGDYRIVKLPFTSEKLEAWKIVDLPKKIVSYKLLLEKENGFQDHSTNTSITSILFRNCSLPYKNKSEYFLAKK